MKRKKLYKIDNEKQLAEIVSPVRSQICLALEMLGECSTTALAGHLGRSPESLYYHMARLEKVGLLQQTGIHRSSGGREEALYSLCARRVRVNTSVREKKFIKTFLRGFRILFRYAERCFARSFSDSSTVLKGRFRECRIIQMTARLSRQDVIELNRKLLEIESYLESKNATAGQKSYLVTLCLSPTQTEEKG